MYISDNSNYIEQTIIIENLINLKKENKIRCLHDSCPMCHGTGKKHNGEFCFHNISCPCPKCSPWC